MSTTTINPFDDYSLLYLYSSLRGKHNLEPIDLSPPPESPQHPIAIEMMNIITSKEGCQDFTWARVCLMINQAEADAEEVP